MVLIKPEPEPEVTQTKNQKTADPSGLVSISGDASDGFETASEGAVDSDRDDAGEVGGRDNNSLQQVGDALPDTTHSSLENAGSATDLTANPPDDDASIQDALTRANEAKAEGNKLFGGGQYEEALSKYELSLQLAPDMPSSSEIRSICHANRAICFLKLGKYEDTIKECTKALELNPTYVKPLLRRAEAQEKLENFEEAIADMKKVLESDPSNDQARRAIFRLEPLAAEKRERMKEEMIGKLKEMGNSLLGRFGMSVDNFKAVKDPNTGSYSISFQR